ncbi:hypothetical protein KEJ25_07355 [Candidatus Bathyarchaeota archaeon]|nr:hypothetical protein [Candidatus Bathyarchaeota archaeon]
MIYITIKSTIPREGDEFHCGVTSSREEAVSLIEAGFEFVMEYKGELYFRKRK